ncbi:MAG TPA: hypothetical protein VE685_17825 [Thermoanaerobaculia bacterium]|nr:hypothetical protein [Thermoanaerobaculia bacterium]
MRKDFVSAVVITVLCLAIAIPATAADRAIRSGIDIWATKADGRTHYDFAGDPIPAGFFCPSSAPFSDIIFFRGSPLATDTPGALGDTDTIVQRLDDAVFNKRGVAVTRIQLRALSLASMFPVKTSCGQFHVKAFLDGDQPITSMRIIRETPTSGSYIAPLALNVKMVFTPADNQFSRPRVLRKSIRFLPKPNATWTSTPPARLVTHTGFVKVDTDGDGTPDSILEGTSPSFSAAGNPLAKATAGCHCADGACSKMHCPDGSIVPGPYPSDTTVVN